MLVVVQARWTRPSCWWTSRPRGTAASASSPSRTRRRWTECARSTSTPSRTRRWHPHAAWRELLLTRLLLLQVECKKAQPKEVVQAANTAALLGKRVILSNLGLLPQLALGQGGAQSAAVAAAGPPAVAAVGAAGQQQPQLGHGAQLQAALQHQLAASAALGGYLLYIFTRSIWRLSAVWTFIHCIVLRAALLGANANIPAPDWPSCLQGATASCWAGRGRGQPPCRATATHPTPCPPQLPGPDTSTAPSWAQLARQLGRQLAGCSTPWPARSCRSSPPRRPPSSPPPRPRSSSSTWTRSPRRRELACPATSRRHHKVGSLISKAVLSVLMNIKNISSWSWRVMGFGSTAKIKWNWF